jgi:hypothetical protein
MVLGFFSGRMAATPANLAAHWMALSLHTCPTTNPDQVQYSTAPRTGTGRRKIVPVADTLALSEIVVLKLF